MSANYHADFWIAVTTAAPVLALAHAVVVQRFDSAVDALYSAGDLTALLAEGEALQVSGQEISAEILALRPGEDDFDDQLRTVRQRSDKWATESQRFSQEWRRKKSQREPSKVIAAQLTGRVVSAVVGMTLSLVGFGWGLQALAKDREGPVELSLWLMVISAFLVFVEVVWGVWIRGQLRSAGMPTSIVQD